MTLHISMLQGSHDQILILPVCSGEVAVMIYNSNDTSDLMDTTITCRLQWHDLPDLGENGKAMFII